MGDHAGAVLESDTQGFALTASRTCRITRDGLPERDMLSFLTRNRGWGSLRVGGTKQRLCGDL